MPRTWRPPAINPLGLKVFTAKASGGANAAFRSARALLSSACLAYPRPGLFYRNLLRDDDNGSEDKGDGVVILAVPSQCVKALCAGTASVTRLNLTVPKPVPGEDQLSAHCQEAISFAVRHSFLSSGWALLGPGRGLETLWVKGLDLSEEKNAVDGLKLELAFTGRVSPEGLPGLGLSLEACKVSTRKWEPRARGEDGDVVVLPDLRTAAVIDAKTPGYSTLPGGKSDDNEAEGSRWLQAFGLVLPQGEDSGEAGNSSLDLACVRFTDGGNAVGGFYHTAGADVENLPSERVPRAALLAETPTVKRMAKKDEERVLGLARSCLVAAGLPVGLAPKVSSATTAMVATSSLSSSSSTVNKTVEVLTVDMGGGGRNGGDAIDITALAAAAEASIAKGECTPWAKGAAATHSIGRAAPPLFFTGHGAALATTLPRPQPPKAKSNENGCGDGWGDQINNDECSSVASAHPKEAACAKVVASCFVDLSRVAACLSLLPKLAEAKEAASASVSLASSSKGRASSAAAAAGPKAKLPATKPQIGAKKKALTPSSSTNSSAVASGVVDVVTPPAAAALPTLENWVQLPDGRFKGAVYGRKGFAEGQEVTTGAITKRTSTEVTTSSGSRLSLKQGYRLGVPKAPEQLDTAGIAPKKRAAPAASPVISPPAGSSNENATPQALAVADTGSASSSAARSSSTKLPPAKKAKKSGVIPLAPSTAAPTVNADAVPGQAKADVATKIAVVVAEASARLPAEIDDHSATVSTLVDQPVAAAAVNVSAAMAGTVTAGPLEALVVSATAAAALLPGDLQSALSLSGLKASELKDLCKARGLAPMRTKAEMLAQLASLA